MLFEVRAPSESTDHIYHPPVPHTSGLIIPSFVGPCDENSATSRSSFLVAPPTVAHVVDAEPNPLSVAPTHTIFLAVAGALTESLSVFEFPAERNII